MHRTEPSRIQGLSLQLMDKISHLVDFNEKLFDLKHNAGNQSKQKKNYENRNDQNRNLNKGRNRRHNHKDGGYRRRPNNRNQNEN